MEVHSLPPSPLDAVRAHLAANADVAPRRAKEIALHAFIREVLTRHDATFRVDMESDGLLIEDLYQMGARELAARCGDPIRYALVSPIANPNEAALGATPDAAGTFDVQGVPRRTAHRFQVVVWYEETVGSYDAWEDALESRDGDAPGLLVACRAAPQLHALTVAEGGALAYYGALLGQPDNGFQYRAAFGVQGAVCHYAGFQLTLT